MGQPPEDAWPTLEETRYIPPAPMPPPPPDRRIGAGMLLAIGAIGLVAIGLLLALLITHRQAATATTVLLTTTAAAGHPGTTTAAAAATRPHRAAAEPALARLGLRVASTPVTSSQPAGTIVDQAPAAGSEWAKGDVVTLSVAPLPHARAGERVARPRAEA